MPRLIRVPTGAGPTPAPPASPLGAPPVPGAWAAPRRSVENTESGLLWSAIGFAILWIPFVGVVGGILALVGFVYLFLGRREFGPEHHRWVLRGSALFLGGIAGSVAATVVLVWAQFQIVMRLAAVSSLTSASSGSLGGGLAAELLVATAVLAVLGVLGLLARVFMVYALADRAVRRVLWIAFAVGAVVLAAFAVGTVAILSPAASAPSAFVNYANFTDLSDVATALPAIPFAWAYYRIRTTL